MPPKSKRAKKSGPRKRRQRGGNVMEKAQKAAEVIRDVGRVLKDTQLISKTAGMFNPNVGTALETVGLGRRRRQMGGSIAGDVFSTLGRIASAPVMGVLGGISGLTQGLSGLGAAQQGGSAYGSRPVLM